MSLTGKEAKIYSRLFELIETNWADGEGAVADAIMREFALRPVAQGVVGEDGEVELYQWWENYFARVSGTKAGKVTAVINGTAIVEVDEIPGGVTTAHSAPSTTETPAPPQPAPHR